VASPVVAWVIGPAAHSGREAGTASAQSGASIVITDVTVVDVVNGERQTHTTLVEKGGQNAIIGKRKPVPEEAVRLDGTGTFLIPGLWNAHSHNQISDPQSLELYLANGVVGTRDMESDADFILPLRDRTRNGDLNGRAGRRSVRKCLGNLAVRARVARVADRRFPALLVSVPCRCRLASPQRCSSYTGDRSTVGCGTASKRPVACP
jgi:hypothetical protein